MSDSTALELEILRGVAGLLRPEAQKIVWDEVLRIEREAPPGTPPLIPTTASGQTPINPAALISALRHGLRLLPMGQKRVVEEIARGLIRLRQSLRSEEIRDVSHLEASEEERDAFRRLLDAEETLRIAAGHQLGKAPDTPAVDSFMEALTHLTRGFYKSRLGALGHADAAQFAAEAVARFFREGVVDETGLRGAQIIAQQADLAETQRGFAPTSFLWARQMLRALERLAAEASAIRGEDAAEFAREWTLARFAESNLCDKYLGASVRTWHDLADRRAEEVAHFKAEHHGVARLEARLESEIQALERLVNSPDGFSAFGEIREPAESLKRLLGLLDGEAVAAAIAESKAASSPSKPSVSVTPAAPRPAEPSSDKTSLMAEEAGYDKTCIMAPPETPQDSEEYETNKLPPISEPPSAPIPSALASRTAPKTAESANPQERTADINYEELFRRHQQGG